MGLTKSFLMALSSIINNKVRSLLTMLGIIIGIAAVIILVSVMNGLTSEVNKVFSEFGTTSLTTMITPRSNKDVEIDELYEFIDQNPDLYSGVMPNVTATAQIKTRTSGDDYITSTCTGATEDSKLIKRLDVAFGRFISYADCVNRSNVCVIGSYQALYFFESCEKAIGQTLKISGMPYTVIGVIEESEDSSESSADDSVYIPYTLALAMNGTNKINAYTVDAKADEVVDRAKAELESFLLKKVGDSDYFSVTSLKAIVDSMMDMMGKMETTLVAIAGISLLVGGIGIMNIMLVSVSERTREIGIRKSLGAKHKHIMMQFVMEAGTVSCIGGIIGIVIGASLSLMAGRLLDMDVAPSMGAVGLAFGVSVGIGIIFGFLPARKAAKLNPIDALRSD